jgi:hypothetical protein
MSLDLYIPYFLLINVLTFNVLHFLIWNNILTKTKSNDNFYRLLQIILYFLPIYPQKFMPYSKEVCPQLNIIFKMIWTILRRDYIFLYLESSSFISVATE